MLETLIPIFISWGLIGYIATPFISKHRISNLDKRGAILLLIALGPLCWAIFPFALIKYKIDKKKAEEA